MTKMFFPLYLVSLLGYSIAEATRLMSSYGLGLLAGALMIGFLVDIFPAKVVAVAAFSISATCLVLLTFFSNPTFLIVVLLLAGIADSGANVTGQRLLLATTSELERPQGQALIRVGNNLGAATAGLLCGSIAMFSYSAVFIFDAFCSFGAAIIVLTKVALSHPAHKDCREKKKISKASPFFDGLFLTFEIGVLLIAVCYHTLYFTLGNYIVKTYGGAPSDLGIQFTINAILVVLLQLRITRLTRETNRVHLAFTGTAALAIGFFLLSITNSFSTLVCSTIAWTIGEMLLFPLINLTIMKRAAPRRSGQYFGFAAAVWNSAAFITPLAISCVISNSTLSSIWGWCLAACLVASIFICIAIRHFERTAPH